MGHAEGWQTLWFTLWQLMKQTNVSRLTRGKMIKQLIGDQLDEYLEKDDNLDKWQSNLRILITKWFGQAWENLNKDYPNFR